MRKIKQTERPFHLRYICGERCLFDSARTYEGARERAMTRLKSHPRERAEIYRGKDLMWALDGQKRGMTP